MANTAPFISDRVKLKLREVAERFMTFLTNVERQGAATGADGYNQSKKDGTWSIHLNNQKCDVEQSTTILTGEQQNRDMAMIVGRYKFTFPYGTDISVADRIVNLRDRDGNLVDASINYFEVKELIPDDTSLTVSAQAIH